MALSTLSLRLRELLSPITFGEAARYTASDVRTLLDPSTPVHTSLEEQEERRDAVIQIAARPSAWTGRLGRQRAWELGRLADRLPTIVGLYSRGVPLEEVAHRERCLTAYTVERALDAACACIAEQLNSRRSADDRLVA